ncbi:MAG: DsbA family oxidoreductase [Burkholderiaceae bacterium]
MKPVFRIDFVSDVSCPWCAIGLGALETSLDRLRDELGASIHFQPFELNPRMGPDGQDIGEHIAQKYGSSPQQQAATREMIRQRGADVGFVFRPEGRGRIYNTFDAHRLLHWAHEEGRAEAGDGEPGQQRRLKKALFAAYFTEGRSPASHEVLVEAAEAAGLDAGRAREVLASDEFADDVREREAFWREREIHAVPAIVIDDTHLVSGGQPTEVFERILRKLAERRRETGPGA